VLSGGQQCKGIRIVLFVLLATILGLAELCGLCLSSRAVLLDSAVMLPKENSVSGIATWRGKVMVTQAVSYKNSACCFLSLWQIFIKPNLCVWGQK